MTPEQHNELIQHFMTEFDLRHKAVGFDSGGGRFVRVGDKTLSQMEYVEFQLKRLANGQDAA